MLKPIFVNSYPRSGSVFLAELLLTLEVPDKDISVIHVPRLIGIEDVITITILRDPRQCITSNIFKASVLKDIPEDLSVLDQEIYRESESYSDYLNIAKNKSAYIVDFNKMVQDPTKEINKFLRYYNIDAIFFANTGNVFDKMQKQKYLDNLDDLHGGHFPREAEKNKEYARIFEYLNQSPILNNAFNLYNSTVGDLI